MSAGWGGNMMVEKLWVIVLTASNTFYWSPEDEMRGLLH